MAIQYFLATDQNNLNDPIRIYRSSALTPGMVRLCEVTPGRVPVPKEFNYSGKMNDPDDSAGLTLDELAAILSKLTRAGLDPQTELNCLFDVDTKKIRFARPQNPRTKREIIILNPPLKASLEEIKKIIALEIQRQPAQATVSRGTSSPMGRVNAGHKHTGRPVTSWTDVSSDISNPHNTKPHGEESKIMTDHGEMLMLVPAAEGVDKMADVRAVDLKDCYKTHIPVLGYRQDGLQKIVSVQGEYRLALDVRDHDPREGVISPQAVMQYILPNMPMGVRLLVNPDTGVFRFLPVTEKFDLRAELTFEPRKTNRADFTTFLQASAQGNGRATKFYAQCEEDYLRPPKNFATRVWREALGNPKLPTTGSARRWLGEPSPGAHISLAL